MATHRIQICMGSSCFARGNETNLAIIEEYLRTRGDTTVVDFRGSRCEGRCSAGPNLEIDGVLYSQVDSETLIALLNQCLN